MDKYIKKELIELAAVGVYLAIVLGLASLMFGFGAGGFERSEILSKNNFYIPYGILFFVLGIVSLKVIGLLVFKSKDKQFEGTIVHDPEQTPLKNFKLFTNPFLLGYFFLIIFLLLGWLSSRYQTFFTDIPQYEQQFTIGADLFFSVYPASPSETLGALFVISLIGFILGYLAWKKKIDWWLFYILFVVFGSLGSMIFGLINHLARYGSSEIAITNVLVFWFVGGLITTITGSMIPFFIMHDVNNFFFRLSKLFSSDIVTFITFISIGILIALFLLVFFKTKNKKIESKT